MGLDGDVRGMLKMKACMRKEREIKEKLNVIMLGTFFVRQVKVNKEGWYMGSDELYSNWLSSS